MWSFRVKLLVFKVFFFTGSRSNTHLPPCLSSVNAEIHHEHHTASMPCSIKSILLRLAFSIRNSMIPRLGTSFSVAGPGNPPDKENFEKWGRTLGRAIHGPVPVQGETLEDLSGPLVPSLAPKVEKNYRKLTKISPKLNIFVVKFRSGKTDPVQFKGFFFAQGPIC